MINKVLKYKDLLDFLETCYDYGASRMIMIVLKPNEAEEIDWVVGIVDNIDKENRVFTIQNGLNRNVAIDMIDVETIEILKRSDSIYYEIV